MIENTGVTYGYLYITGFYLPYKLLFMGEEPGARWRPFYLSSLLGSSMFDSEAPILFIRLEIGPSILLVLSSSEGS